MTTTSVATQAEKSSTDGEALGTPPSSSRRLPALDVLRGLAILGTFLTNIWIFSGAADGASSLVSEVSAVVSTAVGLVTDGKWIGLLTIMFGIGLEIQRQSALRRGDSWPGRYPWRAGLLVLDGLLNYLFIFEFDVLMGYGLTGLVVAAIMATSPKAQKVWMIIGVSVHLAFMILPSLFQTSLFALFDPESNSGIPPSPADIDEITRAEQASMTSNETYWAGVVDRTTNFWAGRGEIPIMFTMGLGLFLVGAHLYRAGLFREEGRRLRFWVMGLSFGIGLPIDWTLRLNLLGSATDGFDTSAITRYVTSSMVAFGILALVAHFYVHRSGTGPVGTALSYVGRMALTCYILQNLVGSIVFYPWGLGMASRIAGDASTLWTLLIYLLIAAGLIGFSALWLSRFSRGPVELVWHRSYEAIGRVLDRRSARRRAPTT